MAKVSFRNDYATLMHPNVYRYLEDKLDVINDAYGNDSYSQSAKQRIIEKFGLPETTEVYFLAGGTQTNMVAISYILRDFEAVIAASSGHINVHESGAVEASGHKILTAPGKDGKLRGEDIDEVMRHVGDEHVVAPELIYISNATETGTIYTKEELRSLHDAARRHGLLLFMDGARLGNALMSDENDLAFEDIGHYCDAFYLGGTKNGLPLGEALVLINPVFHHRFANHIKARGAMLAKGYFVGMLFDAILQDDLYFSLAKHANDLSSKLQEVLKNYGLNPEPSPTNQVFVQVDDELGKALIREFSCEIWEKNEKGYILRFVTSYRSKDSDIEALDHFLQTQ